MSKTTKLELLGALVTQSSSTIPEGPLRELYEQARVETTLTISREQYKFWEDNGEPLFAVTLEKVQDD